MVWLRAEIKIIILNLQERYDIQVMIFDFQPETWDQKNNIGFLGHKRTCSFLK